MFVYYKCYISIELTFLRELVLIRQSKECDVCHSWYFFHELLMLSMNLIVIAILNIKIADYRCNINGISKNEAINLMQNVDLTEKSGT